MDDKIGPVVSKSHIAGVGVFAVRAVPSGELVETCRVVPLGSGFPCDTALQDYRLAWTQDEDCIAGGCALFYNHSDSPNVELRRDHSSMQIFVLALRDVRPGEELLCQYKCPPWW